MKIQILKKDSSKGLKLLRGINRAVVPGQVTKLAKSIENMGIIRPLVVADISFLEEKGTYILDGQHLFYALIRGDMDIPYVKIPIKDKRELIEKIALLNSSSKSWMMKDYIMAWSEIVPDYKKLGEYFNTYDFEVVFIAEILSGVSVACKGTTVIKKIKSGEFKISEESKKVTLLDCLTDVLKILPRMDRFQNLYVCREYVNFYSDMGKAYNHEKLIKSLASQKSKFMFVTQEPGKLVETFKKLI